MCIVSCSLFTVLCGCPAEPSLEDAGASSDAAALDAPPDTAIDAGSCDEDADCDDGLFCTTERCAAGRCTIETMSCDDGLACTTDACDEAERRCTHDAPDEDGDGSGDAACVDDRGMPLGEDCDDGDATRAPGNAEICDAAGHDEDCDPTTRGGTDADGDGAESSACCVREASGTLSCGPDCRDDDRSIQPTASEVCNGVDDDCDGRTDDIIDGTVICEATQTRPCDSSCGLPGTQSCNDSCLGWDTCVADEVCNGCDDDDDGADDEDFACVRGASSACTTTCGTTGTQLCDTSCSFTTCEATEVCNYCDDDADGNFHEERPFATFTATGAFRRCTGHPVFGGATCDTLGRPDGYDEWATLIDGTADGQAGAIWFETDWRLGWGATEIAMELEATAITTSPVGPGIPRLEQVLGGWAIVVGRGTPGVGTPARYAIPTTIEGVAARWSWSQFDEEAGMYPPSDNEGVRGLAIRADGTIRPGASTSTMFDRFRFTGDPLMSGPGAQTFDGPSSGTRTQRMVLRYTPDDPSSPGADEESLAIVATAGLTTTHTYLDIDALPVGAGPLWVGLVATSFTRTGVPGQPPTRVVGVPVRARAHIEHFTAGCCGPPTLVTYMTSSRAGVCP